MSGIISMRSPNRRFYCLERKYGFVLKFKEVKKDFFSNCKDALVYLYFFSLRTPQPKPDGLSLAHAHLGPSMFCRPKTLNAAKARPEHEN